MQRPCSRQPPKTAAHASVKVKKALRRRLDQPPGPHATKWLATSENNDQWIEFDERHYRSMYADMSRTEMFTQTLEKKLSKFPPKTAVVCDLGTGPYLLFARLPRQQVLGRFMPSRRCPVRKTRRGKNAQLEAADNSGVEPGVIELVCGFRRTSSSLKRSIF